MRSWEHNHCSLGACLQREKRFLLALDKEHKLFWSNYQLQPLLQLFAFYFLFLWQSRWKRVKVRTLWKLQVVTLRNITNTEFTATQYHKKFNMQTQNLTYINFCGLGTLDGIWQQIQTMYLMQCIEERYTPYQLSSLTVLRWTIVNGIGILKGQLERMCGN